MPILHHKFGPIMLTFKERHNKLKNGSDCGQDGRQCCGGNDTMIGLVTTVESSFKGSNKVLPPTVMGLFNRSLPCIPVEKSRRDVQPHLQLAYLAHAGWTGCDGCDDLAASCTCARCVFVYACGLHAAVCHLDTGSLASAYQPKRPHGEVGR